MSACDLLGSKNLCRSRSFACLYFVSLPVLRFVLFYSVLFCFVLFRFCPVSCKM